MTPVSKLGALVRHPISVIGVWIAALSAVLFLTGFAASMFGFEGGPYLGIVFFLVLPAFFVFGLALIPVGLVLERRRRHRGLPPTVIHWPVVDLNDPHLRHVASIIVVVTVANIVIVSLAAYSGIEYMDSVAFCGQVCHKVMDPEFSAYQDGPHSRVTCVQCHIGAGASWFVKSKLSGTRQVIAVTFNTYSRPIAAPVTNLRPARDTCEQCHWPAKFHGDKLNVVREYASDEANTETTTTVRVHVGGMTAKPGVATGIHWHVDPGNAVDYVAVDDKRQVIGKVVLRDRNGAVVREYVAEGVTPEQLAKGEVRRMDCMDCHNRPTHPFSATAERAVDQAVAGEAIARNLPFVKREAVAALKTEYPSREAATKAIGDKLATFYQTQYADLYRARRQDIDLAIAATQRLYGRNVFPGMKVTWGSYPNNIGHTDFPGCWRCHDDKHTARDGRTIQQDCELCHKVE
jgi:nitrate/TMAO reductase-like tetraheme cytochrome c subunit